MKTAISTDRNVFAKFLILLIWFSALNSSTKALLSLRKGN